MRPRLRLALAVGDPHRPRPGLGEIDPARTTAQQWQTNHAMAMVSVDTRSVLTATARGELATYDTSGYASPPYATRGECGSY